MMVQRARNVLAYGTVPIIIYIDAVDLVRGIYRLLTLLPPVIMQLHSVINSFSLDFKGGGRELILLERRIFISCLHIFIAGVSRY